MTEHRIGTQEEWQAERDELLKEEKELTRRGDELARKRRELPWVPVEKDYRFETEGGEKTLAELFDGRSQLLIYHFMFGPSWTAAARSAPRSRTRSPPRSRTCRPRTRRCCSTPARPLENLSPTGSGWAGRSTGSRAAAATSTATSASSTRRRS